MAIRPHEGGKTARWGGLKLVQVEKPQTVVFLLGALTKKKKKREKYSLEKMTGLLNPLSTVIENKCGASLAILTYNPITVLTEPTGPFALFQLLTLLLLLCLSSWLSSEQRGVPKLIDPCFWRIQYNFHGLSSLSSLLAGILFSVSPTPSTTSRCPLGDVAMETWRVKAMKCLSIVRGLSRGLFFQHAQPAWSNIVI